MPGPASATTAVRTLLLTDIVDSTRLVETLGDARSAEAFALHDRVARDLARRHGGLEIDKTDGFLFLFERPIDAVLHALEYHRELESLSASLGFSLAARASVHLGELRLQPNAPSDVARGAKPLEVEGIAKPVTARLLGLARAGQTLLTRAAHDLARRAAIGDARLDGVSWLAHGPYVLKGVEDPLEVFEAGVEGLSPLAPPSASDKARPAVAHAARAPGNLPPQLSSFVGREEDLARLRPLLASARLLTLTGIGGCGKTRLALKLAEEAAVSFAHGAWFVELAALSDSELVAEHVATAFGLGEQSGRGAPDVVMDYLREKRLLLVLDNCEHLVTPCARLAEQLLRAAPGLTILATSREALGIAGELIHPVAPLPVPGAAQELTEAALTESAAARLFVERARSVRPDLVVDSATAASIAEACRRLDGIPLAIELAAARAKALSVAEIVGRLNDCFGLLTGGSRTALARHQTLRAAMDWSYQSLEPSEQALLRRASVFAGGWTLQASEQVCAGPGVESGGVLDLLCRLVDKSLVVGESRGGVTRYRMLETVKQYAREKLNAAGEGERARERHLDHYLALAERAEPEFRGAGQVAALARLDVDHENFLAAIEHCTAAADRTEKGLRLTAALGRYWTFRGHWQTGRRLLSEALARPEAGPQGAARVAALLRAGALSRRLGDKESARELFDESLALARGLRDERGIAEALEQLGSSAYASDDYAASRTLYEESLSRWRVLGDGWGTASALHGIGTLLTLEGDFAAARTFMEEGLVLWRSLGDKRMTAQSLADLGIIAAALGQHVVARCFHEESLGLRREIGDRVGVASSLRRLGRSAYAVGDHAGARALHDESLVLRRELGDTWGLVVSLSSLGHVARDQGDTISARALYEECLTHCRALAHDRGVADALNGLGDVARAEGDIGAARRLHEESLAISRALGNPLHLVTSLTSLAADALSASEPVLAAQYLAEASPWLPAQPPAAYVLGFAELSAHLAVLRGAPEIAARLAGAADCFRGTWRSPGMPAGMGWEQHADLLRRYLGPDWRQAASTHRGPPRPPVARAGWEELLGSLRDALGSDSFEAALASGRALDLDAALALAREAVAAA